MMDFTHIDVDECIVRRRGIVPKEKIRKMREDLRVAMKQNNWPTFPEPSFKLVEQTEYVEHE